MKMAFRRIGLKTLATFLHSLANMTSAGLPILRSLASIQSSQRNPKLRRALTIAQQSVVGGSSLAEGLALSGSFPPLVITMVSVAENAGTLDETVADLADHYDWKRSLRQDVLRQALYPMLLVPIGLVLMGVFLTIMDTLFDGSYLGSYISGVVMAAAAIALFVVGHKIAKPLWREAIRGVPAIGRLGRSIPVFGALWAKLTVSNFAQALYLCTRAGLPIVDALRESGGASGSVTVQMAAERAARTIQEGTTLREALARTGVFSRHVLEVVEIAEESGKLEERLGHLAGQLREEVRFAATVTAKVSGVLFYLIILAGMGAAVVIGYMTMFSNLWGGLLPD